MPTKNMRLELGTLTVTDESGKQFEIGEMSDIEITCEQDHSATKIINSGEAAEITLTMKIPLRSRLRFKWEMYKAKRRMKRLIKALYNKNEPHEFTINFKRGENDG